MFTYGKKDDTVLKELDEIINADLLAKPRKISEFGGGKILKKTQIRKLRGELKNRGVFLILQEDLNIKRIVNQFKPIRLNGLIFDNPRDLFFFMKKKGYAGAFDSRTKQMILAEKSTELVAFHEKAHLQHFEELGETYHTLPTWDKETYVWEQIFSRKRNWTKEELERSLNYVNRERRKAGIPVLNIRL